MTDDMKQSLLFREGAEFAASLDMLDTLSGFRDRFFIPRNRDGGDSIYFCGNSLGLQPRQTSEYIQGVLDVWRDSAVKGHFANENAWTSYHEVMGEALSNLVGAKPSEVVAMNSLTVNLHLMLVSFYRPDAFRKSILMEEKSFASDRYAVASQLRYHGSDPSKHIVEIPLDSNGRFTTEGVLEVIERCRDTACLVLLGGVNYYNGQFFDIPAISMAAHNADMLLGLDLAHAIGNVPLRLHEWDVDFAVWCSYKYLNAGPGGTAGCFIHERHASNTGLPRFAGWWGHDKATRFDMPRDFVAIPGADGWQLSNQGMVSLAALHASLDMFDEIGISVLRDKSIRLTGYLQYLLEKQLSEDFSIITPSATDARGCQLSLRLPRRGRALFRWLSEHDVVCDWREPDVLRLAPVPFYNTFTEVYRFARLVHEFHEEKAGITT